MGGYRDNDRDYDLCEGCLNPYPNPDPSSNPNPDYDLCEGYARAGVRLRLIRIDSGSFQ